ncbi:hypothetical protein HRbin01_01614 [archaeon HR01]|nr:hypothetical protein HRbin01_01614 [archaeon HR01]
MSYEERLEKAQTFEDIYRLVKQLVLERFGIRRGGMGLILADLPPHFATYHEIGSNAQTLGKVWRIHHPAIFPTTGLGCSSRSVTFYSPPTLVFPDPLSCPPAFHKLLRRPDQTVFN